MKRFRGFAYGMGVAAAGLLLAVGAMAAEEGGSPAEQPVGMYFKWFHFVILAVLTYWVFGRVLPPFFRPSPARAAAG